MVQNDDFEGNCCLTEMAWKTMRELKDKYKKDFEQLRTKMNEFDPCGFIALECPIDEYDYLTNKVLGLGHRKESREKIKETILFELTDYFGEDIQSLREPYKSKFHQALEKFLDDIGKLD
jgi:hypothetical protein